jgi:hypothetical protein
MSHHRKSRTQYSLTLEPHVATKFTHIELCRFYYSALGSSSALYFAVDASTVVTRSWIGNIVAVKASMSTVLHTHSFYDIWVIATTVWPN